MTVYEMARDLAVYRFNTFRLMRRHSMTPYTGSWRKAFTGTVTAAEPKDDSYVPEWVRRGKAKDLTGWTETELRAAWGDR